MIASPGCRGSRQSSKLCSALAMEAGPYDGIQCGAHGLPGGLTAHAMISKGNNSGMRGEAPQRYPDHRKWKEEWQSGKSTGSGVRSGLIYVAPSVIICLASGTQYLLSLTFYISTEEDHIACLARLQY